MKRRLELKYQRELKGLYQRELADKVGCNPVYYMHIETGRRDPSVKLAKRIAKELDMDWSYFFEDK